MQLIFCQVLETCYNECDINSNELNKVKLLLDFFKVLKWHRAWVTQDISG